MLIREGGHSQALKKRREAIDGLTGGRVYMYRLIIVAIAANELIEGADRCGRYWFRVNSRRFNALKQSLEALGKTRGKLSAADYL